MGKEQELMQAVMEDNLAFVHKIISKLQGGKKTSSKKFNINFQDSDGMSILHQAALTGNVEVMKLLMEYGCHVDTKDSKGMRPLHYASWQGKELPVNLLLKAKSSVNDVSMDGNSPLHLASEHGHISVVNLLLQFGADACIKNKQHKTPLDLACEFGRTKVVEALLLLDSAKDLLANSEEDTLDNDRTTCLHLACRNGHIDVILLLLESGIDINRQTLQGTCLHEASKYGKVEVVKLLLDYGIDATRLNSYEQTALEIVNKFTASKAAKELKQILKEASSETNTKSPGGEIPGFGSPLLGKGTYSTLRRNLSNSTSKQPKSPSLFINDGSNTSPNFNSPLGQNSRSNIFAAADDDVFVSTSLTSSASSVTNGSLKHNQSDHRDSGISSNLSVKALKQSIYHQNHLQLCQNSRPQQQQQQQQHGLLSLQNETRSSYDHNHFPAYHSPGFLDHYHGRTSGNGPDGNVTAKQSLAVDSTTTSSLVNNINININNNNNNNRLSGQSYESGVSTSSRQSFHSNGSSSGGSGGGSSDGHQPLEESGFSSLGNFPDLLSQGHSDAEIMHSWLGMMHLDELFYLFNEAGYDMPTISRMTPEDLNAIGITKPNVRKRLKIEISRLNIPDGIPDFLPNSINEWLQLLNLIQYEHALTSQGYRDINSLVQITWEDLEEIGVTKLGHQKKITLAIDRLKKLLSNPSSPSSSNDSLTDVGSPNLAVSQFHHGHSHSQPSYHNHHHIYPNNHLQLNSHSTSILTAATPFSLSPGSRLAPGEVLPGSAKFSRPLAQLQLKHAQPVTSQLGGVGYFNSPTYANGVFGCKLAAGNSTNTMVVQSSGSSSLSSDSTLSVGSRRGSIGSTNNNNNTGASKSWKSTSGESLQRLVELRNLSDFLATDSNAARFDDFNVWEPNVAAATGGVGGDLASTLSSLRESYSRLQGQNFNLQARRDPSLRLSAERTFCGSKQLSLFNSNGNYASYGNQKQHRLSPEVSYSHSSGSGQHLNNGDLTPTNERRFAPAPDVPLGSNQRFHNNSNGTNSNSSNSINSLLNHYMGSGSISEANDNNNNSRNDNCVNQSYSTLPRRPLIAGKRIVADDLKDNRSQGQGSSLLPPSYLYSEDQSEKRASDELRDLTLRTGPYASIPQSGISVFEQSFGSSGIGVSTIANSLQHMHGISSGSGCNTVSMSSFKGSEPGPRVASDLTLTAIANSISRKDQPPPPPLRSNSFRAESRSLFGLPGEKFRAVGRMELLQSSNIATVAEEEDVDATESNRRDSNSSSSSSSSDDGDAGGTETLRKSGSSASLSSSDGSTGPVDSNTLPFANENVGTIKQRNNNAKAASTTAGSADDSSSYNDLANNNNNSNGNSNSENDNASHFILDSQGNVESFEESSTMKRRRSKTTENVDGLQGKPPTTSGGKFLRNNPNSDTVFNDIDGMLMGLTQELDEMLKLQS